MNFITICIGLLPIIFALYVLIMRLLGKEKLFRKLKPMKEKFGKTAGSIIHYISYVVVPFLFGVLIVYFGINGLSIMDFINK